MGNKSLALPPIGLEAVFTFKTPFEVYVKNLLKLETSEVKLEVNSITSLKDYIRLSHRDPFTDIYKLVGLDELTYKQDLTDEVPIITFLYRDEYNSERLFRVPLSYIEGYNNLASVEYINKNIYISLPPVPFDFYIEGIFEDIKDMIATRLGLDCTIMEVTSSEIISISNEEHDVREKIRKNNVTVYKSNLALRLEAENELTAIKQRLEELNIVLGGKNVGIKR